MMITVNNGCAFVIVFIASRPVFYSTIPVPARQMAAKLFDMLSTSTEVDHPMCEECADLVTDGLELELAAVSQEAALYREFVQKLKRQPPLEEDQEALDAELKKVGKMETAVVSSVERRDLWEGADSFELKPSKGTFG